MKRNISRAFLNKYLKEMSRALPKNTENINPLIYREINIRTCGSINLHISSPNVFALPRNWCFSLVCVRVKNFLSLAIRFLCFSSIVYWFNY